MDRKDWLRVSIGLIIGLWSFNFLTLWKPEFQGIWIGMPFVVTYFAFNWAPWRERVKLDREIREFQKGHGSGK